MATADLRSSPKAHFIITLASFGITPHPWLSHYCIACLVRQPDLMYRRCYALWENKQNRTNQNHPRECKTCNNGLKLGSQILIECQEEHPNCQSSTTMGPMTSRGGDHSNTQGIQEKLTQQSGRYPLICIPALSKRLDQMALQAPSNFTSCVNVYATSHPFCFSAIDKATNWPLKRRAFHHWLLKPRKHFFQTTCLIAFFFLN